MPKGAGLVAQPNLQCLGGNIADGEGKLVVEHPVAAVRASPRRFSTDLSLDHPVICGGCPQLPELDLACDAESLQEQDHRPSAFDERVVLDECGPVLEEVPATPPMVDKRIREQGFAGSASSILRHHKGHEILAPFAPPECPFEEFNQREIVLVLDRVTGSFNDGREFHVLLQALEPCGAGMARLSHPIA